MPYLHWEIIIPSFVTCPHVVLAKECFLYLLYLYMEYSISFHLKTAVTSEYPTSYLCPQRGHKGGKRGRWELWISHIYGNSQILIMTGYQSKHQALMYWNTSWN